MARLTYDPSHDYYTLLGVNADASMEAVQRAYRQRAKLIHPDRNPGREGWAKAEFKRLNEAYRVLSDDSLRREYDHLRWPYVPHGASSRRQTTYTDTPPAPDPDRVWEARSAWNQQAWRYEDWAQPAAPAAPPPPADAFRQPSPWRSLLNLLQGPYGWVYLVLALVLVSFVPVALLVNQQAETSAAAVLASPTPASTVTPSLTPTPPIITVPLPFPTAAVPTLPAPSCANPDVTITSPEEGETVPASFPILGSATAPDFYEYRLELAYLGVDAAAAVRREWTLIGPASQQPVTAGELVANAAPLVMLQPGYYMLRLTVRLADDTYLPPCERLIYYPAYP